MLKEKLAMRKNKVIIIIPAYNEQNNIKKVVDNIIRNWTQYDYIVVNDGSQDETKNICLKNNYNLIDLPVNVGLPGAFRAGMRYAYYNGYDYAIQIDGDGQHQPRYIEKMIDCMNESDLDIVIGSRFKDVRKPFSLRMIGSNIITLISWVTTGKYIGDVTSGMRLYNSNMIKSFAFSMNYEPEPDTIIYLINCGARVEEVQVEMTERESGESYLNLSNAIRYMLRVVFSILLFQFLRSDKK